EDRTEGRLLLGQASCALFRRNPQQPVKLAHASDGYPAMALGLINALPRSSLALSTAWFVSHASLAAPCPITISGLASPEWLRAVAAVGELDADGDCASIALAVDADGALLSFTTRDGRVAHRQLTHPSELGATVDALTTVPLTDEA